MKKIENFEKALTNLQEIYQYQEPYETIILTGMVALFEICFEQAWKAMKEHLEYHGINTAPSGSPRIIIKSAYQAGFLHDETNWLEALHSRNYVAHAYNEEIALDIIHKTKTQYVTMFEDLLENLKNNPL
ncbi:MAG: HI0074 family nucleotidyltransferase substrate-binding subunit [Eubacteriales bacterium]